MWGFHDRTQGSDQADDGSTAGQDAYTYDAYGNLVGSTGSDTKPFGFAGAYPDVETGFLYLENRYDDPGTGQFLTVDPDVDETGKPYA
jgi:RHS repeat-associated protein